MCESSSARAQLERLQGRQQDDYGFGHRYASANLPLLTNNTYLYYNSLPEPGNVGAAYTREFQSYIPVGFFDRYHGNLPLDMQPRLDIPQPYTSQYVG